METAIRFTFMDNGKDEEAMLMLKDENLTFYINGEEKQIVGQIDIVSYRKSEEPESLADSREDTDGASGS